MLRKNCLAFSTLGCPDWDLETILKSAAGMGFAAVEVRGIGGELRAERIPCFLPENRGRTRALLEQYQVRICGIDTSCAFDDAAHLEKALEEGRAAIALCSQMGAGMVRVFGDRLPKGREKEVMGQAARGLRSLCDAAEATGPVQVLLEVHGDFNTVEVFSELLPQLEGRPSFGLIWDIEHSFRSYGRDAGAFYRLIRPYIRHVHIKDCRIENGEALIRAPGEGSIPIPQIVAQLERDGYTGYYSFEWEKRWHPEIAPPERAFPAYAAYMKQIGKELSP